MKPILLHYYITNRCNARCVFCSIWSEKPKYDAKFKDVKRNLFHARKAGCRFVDFTGGEPLLHDQLPLFLKEAKSQGFLTSVTTNCILFPERARDLAGLIDLLHFSLDADSEDAHDSLRGVKSYSKVFESIDIALQNRMYPDLLFTYTDSNINSFDGVVQYARKKRLMVILDPVFSTQGPDRIKPTTHQKAIAHGKQFGVYLNKAHLTLREKGGNHIRDPLCKAVESVLVVLPDNTLALPCFHHRASQIAIGENSFLEIMKQTSWQTAREKQGRYSFCEGCHINCYFDPTFQFSKSPFYFQSILSKLKYAFTKYVLYHRPWPKIF